MLIPCCLPPTRSIFGCFSTALPSPLPCPSPATSPPQYLLWSAAAEDPAATEAAMAAFSDKYASWKKAYDISKKTVTRTNYEVRVGGRAGGGWMGGWVLAGWLWG